MPPLAPFESALESFGEVFTGEGNPRLIGVGSAGLELIIGVQKS